MILAVLSLPESICSCSWWIRPLPFPTSPSRSVEVKFSLKNKINDQNHQSTAIPPQNLVAYLKICVRDWEGGTMDSINKEELWRQTYTLSIHDFPPSSCANILSNPQIYHSGEMDTLDIKCDVIKPNISDRKVASFGLKNMLVFGQCSFKNWTLVYQIGFPP